MLHQILPPSFNAGNSSICRSKSLFFGSPSKIDAPINFLAFTMISESDTSTLDDNSDQIFNFYKNKALVHSAETHKLKHKMSIDINNTNTKAKANTCV